MALVLNLLLTFILHLVKGHLELNRKTLNKNLETAGMQKKTLSDLLIFAHRRLRAIGLHISILLSGKKIIFSM